MHGPTEKECLEALECKDSFIGKLSLLLLTMGDREFRPRSHIYAGFMGGLVSSVALQPLDLIKTRLQQTHGLRISVAIREAASMGQLWRGTLPSAIRTSLGASIYMTSLGKLRSLAAGRATASDGKYSSLLPQISMPANLLAGSAARAAVGLVMMPITVVKVRFESSTYSYGTMREAFRSIWRTEGLRGFFSGYGATISRDAPYAGLYMLFYEQAKQTLNNLFPASGDTRGSTSAASVNLNAAVIASVAATTITAPFDTVKTRVQLQPAHYKSFIHGTRLVLLEHGFMTLFDGLSLRLFRKALSSGISWCLYEELVRQIEAKI